VVHVFTHDSIGLGEDGPTHQSVEQVASLRLIPNCNVWRPADTAETAVAWVSAIETKTATTALILSRQNLPAWPRSEQQMADMRKGGYVLSDKPNAQLVLIATGSEVELAMKAQAALAEQGINARVVSMPCCEAYNLQSIAYQDSVLPPALPKVAIEAGVTAGWHRYTYSSSGKRGAVIGIDRFGESAPAGDLFKYFGFTVEAVVAAAVAVLA
jgi:transketolase